MRDNVYNFQIRILWLENLLGVAIEQKIKQRSIPLTPYYFWPRNDAWELLRLDIDSKTWISEEEKTNILNTVTQIFNSWQKDAAEGLRRDFQNQTIDFKFITTG